MCVCLSKTTGKMGSKPLWISVCKASWWSYPLSICVGARGLKGAYIDTYICRCQHKAICVRPRIQGQLLVRLTWSQLLERTTLHLCMCRKYIFHGWSFILIRQKGEDDKFTCAKYVCINALFCLSWSVWSAAYMNTVVYICCVTVYLLEIHL